LSQIFDPKNQQSNKNKKKVEIIKIIFFLREREEKTKKRARQQTKECDTSFNSSFFSPPLAEFSAIFVLVFSTHLEERWRQRNPTRMTWSTALKVAPAKATSATSLTPMNPFICPPSRPSPTAAGFSRAAPLPARASPPSQPHPQIFN
jgi:hypothetical protein